MTAQKFNKTLGHYKTNPKLQYCQGVKKSKFHQTCHLCLHQQGYQLYPLQSNI